MMSEWIDVEDRFPEDGFSCYLLYSIDDRMAAVGGVHKGVFQVNDDELCHNLISHWMPLPEPPNE